MTDLITQLYNEARQTIDELQVLLDARGYRVKAHHARTTMVRLDKDHHDFQLLTEDPA